MTTQFTTDLAADQTSEAQINRDLLGPLFKTGPRYYATVAVLGAVTSVVFIAWAIQIMFGIGMSGKNRPSFWGLYITTFVFWIEDEVVISGCPFRVESDPSRDLPPSRRPPRLTSGASSVRSPPV